jgi:phenylalanyl-tRNA synthetase alpha chain
MTEMTIEKLVDNYNIDFISAVEKASKAEDIERLRIDYLGRKGKITDLFKSMSALPQEERRSAGKILNNFKMRVESILKEKIDRSQYTKLENPLIDITLPGDVFRIGRYHPITQILRQIKSCFQKMGFSVEEGPEVESEYYNFEALNIPKGHPARDMHDTLYVEEEIVLRTHTSPVQIRVMEKQLPPVRIISPGRCYRKDTPDATHSPVFHQIEGLCVDEGITFADLKGVILSFARTMFGTDIKIRFRPSFFPFTEPSAEYDFLCLMCRGKGCHICKNTGWIEISGAGMVNPAVFKYVNYDSERYTGYAFGMGVERIAMLLYGVQDIRMFYENDLRFLDQF